MAGRTSTRSRRRRRGGALVGSAATALAVFGLGSPAGAATTTATQTFEFFPRGGSSLASCTIAIRADFPFSTATGARAITTVSGTHSACTTGVTTLVGAEFRNTSGDFITTPFTFTHGTTETQTYSSVASDFHSYHQVYFPACGCATDVFVLTVANPK